MMKRKAFAALLLLAAVMLCACTAIPDSAVDKGRLDKKLADITAYKKEIPQTAVVRTFAFGATMDAVRRDETLALVGENGSTLSYQAEGAFEGMVLTYWFDDQDKLVLAEYKMESDALMRELERLGSLLKSQYGIPAIEGYYDYDHNAMTADGDIEQALRQEQAYYYALYHTASGDGVALLAYYVPQSGYSFSISHFSDAYFESFN